MSVSSKQSNTAPERSLDQRMDALGRANQVRSRRAALKADLKRGATTIADVLVAPPDYLLTAKVVDLLMAAPKCGRVKSARIGWKFSASVWHRVSHGYHLANSPSPCWTTSRWRAVSGKA